MDRPKIPLFYRIAIIFSFVINLLLVLILVAVLIALPTVVRPILSDVVNELTGLENAVIETMVEVDQAMPVRDVIIQVLQPITVSTISEAQINAAYVVMYLGGGSQVAGTTYINIPPSTTLPIDFLDNIVMSSTIPVRLNIPVSIPLKETQVGAFAANLKGMLAPITSLLGIK